jgi:hypothetical protein
MIEGTFYNDATNEALAGWTVQITGPVTMTAQTSQNGYFSFMDLPDGDYLVCEALQHGWTQAFPNSDTGSECPGGTFGYRYSLAGSVDGDMTDFRNVAPTAP